jgi:uncharacterized membrane protein (Fun14 family)
MMLAMAMLVALVGAGLMIYTWATPSTASAAGVIGPDGTMPEVSPSAPAEPSLIQTYSPAIFQLGFSFVIGFAIAYVFKTFVRITMVMLGIAIVAGVGMQVTGMLEIDWSVIEHHLRNATLYFHSQTGSFEVLATGMIPPATSALIGMLSGFKRT